MTSKSQNHNYLIYNENGTLELEDNKFEDMDHQIIYNNSHLAIKRKDKIKNLIDEGLKSHIFHFKETITITPKSFTCLDKMIGDSNVVTLTDDIELIYSEQIFYEGGIELSKDNLIIDGKGHSINANNLSRIFLITAKDIVLKNIVFKNGKYFRNSLDDKFQGGGSIHIIKGASVKIENCEFENNYSRVSAGAILNKGNLWIHDSVFKSNSSEFQTGAILNKGKIEAKDSIFINNNAYYYAGAIHNHTDSILNMADCKFCENKVEYYAGAINNLGKISLDNCIFESNRTTNYNGGGAICNWQDLLIKKSVFKNNESKNYGGAIFNRNKLKCDECSFIGNYGRSSSGAIHVDRGELSVTNSRFEKNHSSFGGALRIVYGNATFEKCEFSRNYIDEFTFGGGGSAFDSLHSTIVCSICDFDDNKSPYRGGAAQFAKSDAQINNCSFTNNVAPRAGGGIYLRACKSEVMFCTFSGNHSNVGAAIYDTIGNTKIVSCIFTDNIADSQDSGAIEHSSNDFEIDNCIFENNIPKDKSTDGGLW